MEEKSKSFPAVAEAIDPKPVKTEELLTRLESGRLEFKGSMSYDYRTCTFSKEREDDVAKELAALLNSAAYFFWEWRMI